MIYFWSAEGAPCCKWIALLHRAICQKTWRGHPGNLDVKNADCAEESMQIWHHVAFGIWHLLPLFLVRFPFSTFSKKQTVLPKETLQGVSRGSEPCLQLLHASSRPAKNYFPACEQPQHQSESPMWHTLLRLMSTSISEFPHFAYLWNGMVPHIIERHCLTLVKLPRNICMTW